MADYRLGAVEARFADMIWSREPVSSSTLVRLADEELGWKKSTVFTVLKRLCDKGIFVNRAGCVTSLIGRDEFYSAQSEIFVEESFDGSLPAFFAAFASRKGLSASDAEKLRQLIDEYEEKEK